jgi:DNA topoisomerase VI subunit B
VTADEPLHVTTAQAGSSTITDCLLDMNVAKNEPIVLRLAKRPQPPMPWQGTTVTVLLEGEWNRGRGVRTSNPHFNCASAPARALT